MKTKLFTIICLLFLISFTFSCSEEEIKPLDTTSQSDPGLTLDDGSTF